MSEKIHLFEVGPRDGLQNESAILSAVDRAEFISGLIRAGLKEIEVGAFVRAEKIPQMADTEEVFTLLNKKFPKASDDGLHFWSLVPNGKGLERALASQARHIAVFTAVSDTFNENNIGMNVKKSLQAIQEIVVQAKTKKLKVRGYVSTVFCCPFEGKINPKKALEVIEALAEMGVTQISVGDTIGVATPKDVEKVIRPALRRLGKNRLAVHFHDTRGTALANTLRSLELGIRAVDSSAGGLGGCPFAPGASGNLATEDLVYMLEGMGLNTGVDLDKLCEASLALYKKIQKPFASRYLAAYFSQCGKEKK